MKWTLQTKAECALLLASLLWGLTFPFIKIIILEISPLHLVFLRGLIAALIFLPFVIIIKQNRFLLRRTLPIGAVLGFLYFASYYSQTLGLKTISSGRSAFITNLSVIFVPLLSPIFTKKFPSKNDLIACLISMCGIFFLTDPLSHDGLKIGDFYTLITAICFSIQIHVINIATKKYPNGILFAFWQVSFIAIYASLLLPFINKSANFFPTSAVGIFAIIYLAVMAMVLTTWLQTRFQSHTTAERAAVIYIFEPLFACTAGYILLNETMTLQNLFGGLLIVIAVFWQYILNTIRNQWRKKNVQ